MSLRVVEQVLTWEAYENFWIWTEPIENEKVGIFSKSWKVYFHQDSYCWFEDVFWWRDQRDTVNVYADVE